MRKIIAKILISFTSGIGIGVIISILFSLAQAGGQYSLAIPSFIAQFKRPIDGVMVAVLLYGLLGSFQVLWSKIYDLRGPLLLKTLGHMVLTLVTTLLVGRTLHWFNLDLFSFLLFLASFLISYLVIWTIVYWNKKKEVEEINQGLAAQKRSQH